MPLQGTSASARSNSPSSLSVVAVGQPAFHSLQPGKTPAQLGQPPWVRFASHNACCGLRSAKMNVFPPGAAQVSTILLILLVDIPGRLQRPARQLTANLHLECDAAFAKGCCRRQRRPKSQTCRGQQTFRVQSWCLPLRVQLPPREGQSALIAAVAFARVCKWRAPFGDRKSRPSARPSTLGAPGLGPFQQETLPKVQDADARTDNCRRTAFTIPAAKRCPYCFANSTLSSIAAWAGTRSRKEAEMRRGEGRSALQDRAWRLALEQRHDPLSGQICQRSTPSTSAVARLRSAGESLSTAFSRSSSSQCAFSPSTANRMRKAALRAGEIVDMAINPVAHPAQADCHAETRPR